MSAAAIEMMITPSRAFWKNVYCRICILVVLFLLLWGGGFYMVDEDHDHFLAYFFGGCDGAQCQGVFPLWDFLWGECEEDVAECFDLVGGVCGGVLVGEGVEFVVVEVDDLVGVGCGADFFADGMGAAALVCLGLGLRGGFLVFRGVDSESGSEYSVQAPCYGSGDDDECDDDECSFHVVGGG